MTPNVRASSLPVRSSLGGDLCAFGEQTMHFAGSWRLNHDDPVTDQFVDRSIAEDLGIVVGALWKPYGTESGETVRAWPGRPRPSSRLVRALEAARKEATI